MNQQNKIYIAGHRGLVGSALVRCLEAEGYTNLLIRTHAELDLTSQALTEAFFEQEKPDYVLLAAAKVGGILANSTYPADFIYQNLAIQTNIIHAAYKNQVKRLLFLGSSCIYPRDCPQPMKEGHLLSGPLEPTNRPYALAKIAGIEMCWSYNRQYGTQYIAAMPTNLYGPGDNYDLSHSHVIPALIRKFHEAKVNDQPAATVWGSGRPKREFLYSGDMANACVYLLKQSEETLHSLFNDSYPPLINIGCGEDLTILELAELVREVVGFSGKLSFDTTKPDGTTRKLMDVTNLNGLGWHPRTSLRKGLEETYKDFLNNYNKT